MAAMRRAAIYGTSLVLLHLLVSLVHGMAHLRLHIELGPAGMIFVIVVITICPLLAAVLLWTSQQRSGSALLAMSMAGSFLFGFYEHFVVPGQDHIGQQAPGSWGAVFAITACLLLPAEAIGAFIGIQFLLRRAGSA